MREENSVVVNMDNSFCGLLLVIILVIIGSHYCSRNDEKNKCECETQLVQPPNYDKEALLDLMEQGECVGGTIHEGKFSVFVCKE